MNTIELRNVRKTYDRSIAVDDLSFAIAAGTMFGLLGPNGAGKTSTIRMMIGITLPDSGDVLAFGQPFRREVLKRIGYLPEERGLYPKMKVEDQLAFIGELHGLSAHEAKNRARTWGTRLDILHAFQKRTQELSKGMQQKIQFIATLLHEPEFIIMDEPFSGLDPLNARLLEDVLLDLRKQGRTILFSTHRMDQVEKLCDNICLVNKGQAVLKGNLREIKSRYGHNRVQIAFDGAAQDGHYLESSPLVRKIDRYEGYVSVELARKDDAQTLLKQVSERSSVSRFEVMEPSLEDIFIDVVGKTDG
jgi:ABC-2 type transport system ATP-binding protein